MSEESICDSQLSMDVLQPSMDDTESAFLHAKESEVTGRCRTVSVRPCLCCAHHRTGSRLVIPISMMTVMMGEVSTGKDARATVSARNLHYLQGRVILSMRIRFRHQRMGLVDGWTIQGKRHCIE